MFVNVKLRSMSPVGIVLVSHSGKLAEGLADLLAQIGSDEVPVAVAGGSPSGGLGTDPARVTAAIAQADRGEGIVIIPDLGSSVLTVRALLDQTGGNGRILVDAPFVEGAVAAAVTAASGASLHQVAEAAEAARDVPKL
jgi:phosphoenolpyruvate---glycerone phosphotransferase subunit DhaM